MKYKIEYYLLIGFMKVICILPMKLRYIIADSFGILFYYLSKKRRNITYKNIRLAFPGYNKKKVKDIVKASYKNMSEVFFENFWMDKLKYTWYGRENIEEALAKGKGVVGISIHFGNWEITGGTLAKAGFKMNAVAKKQRNPYINKLITDMREKTGMKVIYKGRTFRNMIKIIKENGVLGLIADQYSKEVEVEFFGHKTWAVEGPARLALKFQAPVIMMYSVKNKDRSYNIYTLKEIKLNYEEDIAANAQIIINEMERIIRENPEQWFWQHKRWKNTIDYD